MSDTTEQRQFYMESDNVSLHSAETTISELSTVQAPRSVITVPRRTRMQLLRMKGSIAPVEALDADNRMKIMLAIVSGQTLPDDYRDLERVWTHVMTQREQGAITDATVQHMGVPIEVEFGRERNATLSASGPRAGAGGNALSWRFLDIALSTFTYLFEAIIEVEMTWLNHPKGGVTSRQIIMEEEQANA